MEAEEEDDDPVDEVEVSADTLNSMVNVIEMPMVDVIQEGGEAVDEDANGEANDPLADDVVEKKVLTNVDANEVVGEGVEKGTGEKEKEGKENEEKKREKKSSSSSLSSHRSSSSKHRSSSSGSSSKSKSSSRDKSKDSHKEKSSSSNSSSSSSRDKDKSRDRHGKDRDKSRDRDRDRHKSSSSSSRHSSSSKSSKDKEKEQKEKDKDVLAKLMPPSLQKLPKIPKKDPSKSSESEELKKGSISIVVRNTAEDRPKTVKVFKSKMRLTGLEEEVKPAPPRPVKKPVVPPVSLPSKRPSPIRDAPVVPEKKIRIDPAERPGAIKLIPPKPKRKSLRTILTEILLFLQVAPPPLSRARSVLGRDHSSGPSATGPCLLLGWTLDMVDGNYCFYFFFSYNSYKAYSVLDVWDWFSSSFQYPLCYLCTCSLC